MVFRALKYRNFRVFFYGQSISLIGTICFMANSAKSVDGQYVSLRANLSRTGKSNMLLSAGAAWACCPIFALIQGGGASFPVGTECKAYTENDVKIKVD